MAGTRHFSNISMIGFMGTGKSSVGQIVAAQLRFTFVDTDDLIESRTGRTISEIFAQQGEPVFRQLENQLVQELASRTGLVIATGGGLPVNPANLESLKSHSLVICLWASPDAIWERVRHQSHRPLLNDPDPQGKIRRLLAEREPFYRQADVLVNTEMRSVREVAQHVVHQFHMARSGKR
ncbi:MAG TPA: shikimate kinase [Verrucomicrobia bacterium]|nr:shikimate kinase [Verrucomicrobiota bacterium]HOP96800.1 shikimate kinase [Verrucomicrobiota bacterium]